MSIDAEDPDALGTEPSAQPEQPRESPFITIWEAPRETIRWVVATDPRRWVVALFFLSGFVGTLSSLPTTLEQQLELEVPVPVIFAGAAMLGLLAIMSGILNAWFKRWVGSLLGGDASRAGRRRRQRLRVDPVDGGIRARARDPDRALRPRAVPPEPSDDGRPPRRSSA
jgi:hypothetical protein